MDKKTQKLLAKNEKLLTKVCYNLKKIDKELKR